MWPDSGFEDTYIECFHIWLYHWPLVTFQYQLQLKVIATALIFEEDTSTPLFHCALNSRHKHYVDTSDAVLRWQVGCVSLSALCYSIIRNKRVTNALFPSTLHHLALQMEPQCNFHLWSYCQANSIRCSTNTRWITTLGHGLICYSLMCHQSPGNTKAAT